MKRLYSLVLIIAVLICSIAPSNPASAQNRSSVLSSLGIVSTSERVEYGVLIKDTVYADASELIITISPKLNAFVQVVECDVVQDSFYVLLSLGDDSGDQIDPSRSSIFIKTFTDKWNKTAQQIFALSTAAFAAMLIAQIPGLAYVPSTALTVFAQNAAGVAAGLFISSDNIYFKGVGNEYLISDGAVSFYRIYERIYYYDSSSYSSSSYRGQTSSHTLDSAYPW